MKEINPRIIKFFNTLADETRLKILVTISKGATTVKDIHRTLGKNNLTLSAISHQLKTMSDLDIVKYKKKGRKKYYRLSHDYCWCILRDAFDSFKDKHSCKNCANIEKQGGLVT